MKSRPILFSGAMVRAVVDGTKTQTRRVIKPQPYIDAQGNACWNGYNYGQDGAGAPMFKTLASPVPTSRTGRVLCPYGAPGDQLWVRETFQRFSEDGEIIYKADPAGFDAMNELKRDEFYEARWRPSIHMPRWASRITLEITGVRVERLQDISEADAKAEGLVSRIGLGGHECWGLPEWGDPAHGSNPSLWNCSAVQAYRALWEQINGAGSWAVNPWVWVVEFKRIEGGAA